MNNIFDIPESLLEEIKKVISPETHINVDGEMKHRFNSDGKLIHHTEDGIRNFHRWFGNSSVVDHHGRPKVLYHGTTADRLDQFYHGSGEQDNGGISRFSIASHFGDLDAASTFSQKEGGHMYPIYLAAKNPLRIEDTGVLHDRYELSSAASKSLGIKDDGSYWMGILRKHGHDGIVYKNSREGSGDSYIPISVNQIKSASGNNGDFDQHKETIHESADAII